MPIELGVTDACKARRGGSSLALWRLAAFGSLLALSVVACNPDQVAGSNALPAGIPDPAQTHNAVGAMNTYRGAVVELRTAFAGPGAFIPISGLLTDELRSADIGLAGNVTSLSLIDSRRLPESTNFLNDSLASIEDPLVNLYGLLQQTRGQATEARGELRTYDPDSVVQLGELYAVQGYAEVFLADLFCSGVPLSTLNYGGDFSYAPGSTTAQVYQHAASLFDSALTLAGAGTEVGDLAAVGKGRALLALDQYGAAATAVAGVPAAYQYAFDFNNAQAASFTSPTGVGLQIPNLNYASAAFQGVDGGPPELTVVDTEGMNGLPFLSSNDPRTPWTGNGANNYGIALYRPLGWAVTGDSPITLASGTEARLIQAEAQLQSGGGAWLATLNALRTDGTYSTQPDSVNPAQTDTIWNAGTGGVAALAPLQDPGSADARVDLLFRERAFWLYLTGHREGDLRRLIRQYGRAQSAVYPSGLYPGAYGIYGSDVTAPIPPTERMSNPLFTGCINRGA